ncbi:MAG: hypothetical protein ACP5KN_21185 [Armatimonadota bacterium]
MTPLPPSPTIGVLNEQPLHAALKQWYAQPEGLVEVTVDGFVVDVLRDDLLIEIQVGNFSSIKQKMRRLTEHHPVRLVYPIPREKWLIKMPRRKGGAVERRKSPKRGRVEEVFKELVSFPALLSRDTFSLEVVFTWEEELRHHDPSEWRNRGWVTDERRLLDVVGRHLFERPEDMLAVLPKALPEQFTTADLAEAMDGPRWLAQKMAYCLRKMGGVMQVGKRGRSKLYVIGQ